MGVGVNEARQYYIVGAIDFFSSSCQLVLRNFVRLADSNDLSTGDEHGPVFDDAQVAHLRAAARGRVRCLTQREELRSVDTKHIHERLPQYLQ